MKKYLALLLTLVLVVTVSVMAVSATTGDIDFSAGGTVSAVCPHCGGENEVQWLPLTKTLIDTWAGNYSTANGTHYYMAEESVSFGKRLSIDSGESLCLHLNGKTVTRPDGARAFSVDGTLNLMDHAANEGLVTCLASHSSGGCVVRVNSSTGVFNMRGGTLELRTDSGKTATSHAGNGGCVWVAGGAEFNLSGGVIKDGISRDGGNVYIGADAVFQMSGGAILNGSTYDYTYSSTSLTNGLNGGNIYLAAGAQFTMTGGSIGTLKADGSCENGGSAVAYGGNIFSDGAVVSISGGTIAGGSTKKCGGNIFLEDGNGVTISGGTIRGGTADDRGGNVYMASVTSNLTISGGTISKGTALGKGTASSTGGGGNVFANNGNLSITGGTITDGEAVKGGNLYTYTGVNSTSNTATIADDTDANTPAPVITKGAASSSGGNIYAAGPLTIGAATISDGTAGSGGNIIHSKTLTLNGTTLRGGSATYGGSLYVSGGTATVNADISGGTAKSRGGNIYMSSTDSRLTVTGGTISNGVCNGTGGGNIYANNGYLTITGGTISGGVGTCGGNIYVLAGKTSSKNYCLIQDDDDPTTAAPVICNGTAEESGGNIYADTSSSLTLGDCNITGGTAGLNGNNIYIGIGSHFTIADFGGETTACLALSHIPTSAPVNVLNEETISCQGPFPGRIVLEGEYDQCYLFGKKGETVVYIPSVALIDDKGETTWFEDNASAVAAYNGSVSYMQANAGALELQGGNYVVDICGCNVNITGTGTVTCFDSANNDFKTNGTATIDGPTLANKTNATVLEKEYYTIEDNGVYSFHLLDMRLTNVAVRPSNTGIYYQGVWLCDETLAKRINTFGVAASLVHLPDENFATDKTALYTQFKQEDFVAGGERSGVLIENILDKAADNNTSRSKRDIYAAAYIVFNNGVVAITDDSIAYSLQDVATIVSENPEAYATSIPAMSDLVSEWKPYGLRWNLEFEVDPDVLQLQTIYEGLTAHHGQLHDHAKTGRRSDGNCTLDEWKAGMPSVGMEYVALLDHRQTDHMYLDAWDPMLFISGTEAMTNITDRDDRYSKFHYNMIFRNVSDMETHLTEFNEQYNFSDGVFEYLNMSSDKFTEVIQSVLNKGGYFVIPHPTSTDTEISEDPMAYYFCDFIGYEVFYYYNKDEASRVRKTKNNYKVWTGLLANDKRVYCAAGCDMHGMPTNRALTTVYSDRKLDTSYIDQLRKGNYTAGPVGIRMCIGDTVMGGTCSFADKRVSFCVGDFHEDYSNTSHTYRVDVVTDAGVVASYNVTPGVNNYISFEADENAKFYRLELHDEDLGYTLLALGNPIWNEAFYD